jgi:hypothetical protein
MLCKAAAFALTNAIIIKVKGRINCHFMTYILQTMFHRNGELTERFSDGNRPDGGSQGYCLFLRLGEVL